MKTITVKESIFADVNCKGGIALICGIVVKETERAVLIHYSLEPIFASGAFNPVEVNRAAWIPKSVIEADGRGAWNIKKWFVAKALKSVQIKPYKP